jgi:proteasome assembly chaperone (PAC2) family protein
MKIVKLASGQVLITDDSDVKIALFNSTDRVQKHISKANVLVITTDGNARDGVGDFEISYDAVTLPVTAGVDALFDELVTNFLNGGAGGSVPIPTGTSLTNGRKIVSSAGTPEALVASMTPCKEVIITAESDNTGVISVGGSGVIAALGTRTGAYLEAGDPMTLNIDDAQKIFIDSTVSGDGVTFLIIS